VLDETWILEDVGQTGAWVLGLPLPWGAGIVPGALFGRDGAAAGRRGTAAVARSGVLEALVVWEPDPDHRSRVEVAGEVLSPGDALYALDPAVLSTPTRDVACWREITLTEDHDRQVFEDAA